jgi:hypothetical protein
MLQKNVGRETYEQWCRAFCARKYNSGFAREMNRSAAAYLDEFPFAAADSEGAE